MDANGSTIPPTKARKTAGTVTRRTWKPHEEVILMGLLKELLAAGSWKSENGFRSGYLTKLEEMLRQKPPGTDLRANPHIQSRVTIWKRHHAAIQTTLADSGGGFNTETKILDVSDIAWDKVVQREPTVGTMRYRPWPFYYDWLEIFGNDGAIGGSSQTVIDAVNQLVEEYADAEVDAEVTASHEGVGIEILDDAGTCEMDVKSQSPAAEPTKPAVTSTSNKACSKSSSPPAQQKELLDGLAVMFKESDNRIVGVMQSIAFQSTLQPNVQPTVQPNVQLTFQPNVQPTFQPSVQPSTESQPMGPPPMLPHASNVIRPRSDVYAILETIEDLDLNDRLDAAERITKTTQRWEMFCGLPGHAWGRYVRKLLNGDFN